MFAAAGPLTSYWQKSSIFLEQPAAADVGGHRRRACIRAVALGAVGVGIYLTFSGREGPKQVGRLFRWLTLITAL